MKLIKLPQVMDMTGLGKTSVYKLMSEKQFPIPVTLIGKSKAWVDIEIAEWVERKISERNKFTRT